MNEIVVDDTTKVNVRWKSGSKVKRAREVTSNMKIQLHVEKAELSMKILQ